MPNLKIFIDHQLLDQVGPDLDTALPPLRALLCDGFAVPPSACQLAVIGVRGPKDQPLVNVELHILPRPERTRDKVTSVCGKVQALVSGVCRTHVAVRCAQLDPESYVALK
jgi:hypothetical protein